MDSEKPKTPKSKTTMLLSINAAAILVAGVLISSAIFFNGGMDFRMVGERSDIVQDSLGEMDLLESVSDSDAEIHTIDVTGNDDYISTSSHEFDSSAVPADELWNESSIVIYATPDIDICVSGSLSDLGAMYWQTSNPNVISGFYDSARTWLGYNNETCRYPVVKGAGTTTITAGTYDGKRKDSITVTVVDPPIDQWKHEVLTLVNKIRTKNKLNQLSWGITCESAADVRANESIKLYAHTRPDGSSWDTVCPAPSSGGVSGENLAIGNAAVSPASVVALWMGSESHRANILNPDYTDMAVGFVYQPDTLYRTYWSQFFSTY
ncbi:hypothetical protein J5868_00275 [Candidatus Saccharibacteria bacterium]|nr:hypothetical protein [Candidatus Saccharibacteria bacterium]